MSYSLLNTHTYLTNVHDIVHDAVYEMAIQLWCFIFCIYQLDPDPAREFVSENLAPVMDQLDFNYVEYILYGQ